MNDVPNIVSELRFEEEQGHLNNKNIYNNVSKNNSSFVSSANKDTEGKQLTDAIKRLANSLSNSIFLQDKNYIVNWINKHGQDTFNIKNNQIQKNSCYSLFFNKSSPCNFCPMKTAIHTKRPHTIQITLPDQTNLEITSIPIFSDQKLIGIIQQIKPLQHKNLFQIKNEASIIQTQQTIIENAALGIIVLDTHLNHLSINPAFSGMTGYEHTEIKRQSNKPLYWPDRFSEDIKTEIQRLIQKGHLKMETYFQRKDRSIFPVSIVGSTFIDEKTQEKHLILIIDDITKSKETERELKISQLLLLSLIQNLEKKVKERTHKIEQLLKQKNEFINQLGHDLKNPLGPLINLIPLLIKKETNPHKKEMLHVIQRNTDHMKNLITKTIELAQLNSGNISLHFTCLNLTEMCDESIKRNHHLLKKNDMIIENNLQPSLVVNADKMRIEELYDNIITNAVKYSPNGGTITITGSFTETTVSISIKDTGVGMNKEQVHHVFDEFYKADPARHDFNSSGLGTSICKRIVEKHGGHIKIESEGIGKGTMVTFTLQKKPLVSNQQKNNLSNQKKKNTNGGER